MQPTLETFPDISRLMPHQIEVLFQSPERFKVLVWHRRARKTTTAIIELIKQAHERIGPYWHIFPTYGEAKDAVWRDPNMLFSIIPKSFIKQVNGSELVVYFNNGSYLQLKGSDDPDALRGANPLGVVFDEYDTQKSEAWPVVEPILRANGGWAWFVGTPRGKKKLFEFYHKGQVDHKEWRSWLLKASSSGIIPQDQLDESRKSMSANLYNQEWECDFLETEGTVFRGVREIADATAKKAEPGHTYIIGADLAKVQDYTVLSVFDRTTNHQVNQDRFQTLEWPFQKARIKSLCKIYNNAVVALDATGLGNPIADDLLRAGVPVEPIKISSESKKEMIEKLSIWIDQRKIHLLPLEVTLEEYDNFSYELGEQGRVKYGAPVGYHDDVVMSHALAITQLHELYKQPEEEFPTLLQQHFRSKVQGGSHFNFEDPWDDW